MPKVNNFLRQPFVIFLSFTLKRFFLSTNRSVRDPNSPDPSVREQSIRVWYPSRSNRRRSWRHRIHGRHGCVPHDIRTVRNLCVICVLNGYKARRRNVTSFRSVRTTLCRESNTAETVSDRPKFVAWSIFRTQLSADGSRYFQPNEIRGERSLNVVFE